MKEHNNTQRNNKLLGSRLCKTCPSWPLPCICHQNRMWYHSWDIILIIDCEQTMTVMLQYTISVVLYKTRCTAKILEWVSDLDKIAEKQHDVKLILHVRLEHKIGLMRKKQNCRQQSAGPSTVQTVEMKVAQAWAADRGAKSSRLHNKC